MQRKLWPIVVVAVVAAAALPGVSQAQSGGGDRAVQIRLGGFFPEGGGPLWGDVEDRFTLDADDFNDGMLGFTFLTGWSNHWEIGANVDFYSETILSEERDFVDLSGLPIFHDTQLEMVPASVDVRYLPWGRYRSRPRGVRVLKPAFYVGAGLGFNIWEYEEFGDFVDDTDPLDPFLFFDHLTEEGVAFQAHVLAGIELPLGPRFNLLFEGRRTWADDELEDELGALDRIELGGTSVFVGGAFRF